MSFFEDASLVLIPSAQKTSKVYSVKPTDGSGDLTFSRSNDTATRVNSAGLIEKVRTNLILQSNTFSNASWSKVGATITAGQSDPNGGSNAFKVELAAGGDNYLYQSIPSIPAGEKTVSCWMRADSAISVSFGSGGATPNQVTLTTSWVRYSFTTTDTTGGIFFGNYFPVLGQPALTFYVFQSQYEMGVMTDYIATTSSAVSVGPVANVPRLDYLGSSCPRLLLEPQRTNLLPMSEQITNATFWNALGGGLVATANVAVSPDGYTNADSITLSNTAARYYVSAAITPTAGQVYTYSVYMKSTSGTLSIAMSGVNGLTASLKTVTTEWQRFTYTFTMHGAGAEYFGIDQRAAGASTSGTLLFWGAQVELGAYATSYIPTLGAAVTRGGDDCGTTSLQSASLIGATAGTFFLQTTKTNDAIWINQRIFLTSTTQRSLLIDTSSGQIRLRIWDASSAQSTITTSGLANGLVKYLIKWDGTNIKVFANGVLVGSSAQPSYAYTTYSALESTSYSNNTISQVLFFPTALSDADCIALTA